MTTALEGGEGSASRPGRFLPPGKTRYPLYRRLGGTQGWSGQVRKISPSPAFDPRTAARSQSLYRLSYLGPLTSSVPLIIVLQVFISLFTVLSNNSATVATSSLILRSIWVVNSCRHDYVQFYVLLTVRPGIICLVFVTVYTQMTVRYAGPCIPDSHLHRVSHR